MGIIAESWLTEEGVQLYVQTATGLRRPLGLIGRAPLPAVTALRFPRCRSVHSVGMRLAIDVVFVDASGQVTSVVELRPMRFVSDRAADETLELRRGEAARLGISAGTKLKKSSPQGGQLFALRP